MTGEGSRTGRGPRLIVAMGFVLLALGALLLWREHGRPNAATEDTSIPVDADTARLRDVPISIEANGTVTSLAVAPVKPRVDGLLVSLAFREGDYVRAGQLLATIDPRPYRAAVARAQATLRKDRALAVDLRLNSNRARELATLGASPAQNADTLKAQAEAAVATADADAADVALAKLNLDFTRVTAPIEGRVGLRQIDQGTIVRAGDPLPLVSVTQMAPISALFPAPQGRLAELRAAQARGPVRVAAVVDGKEVASGTLAAIDSTIDPASGQVKLRAIFPNADRSLWPGELATMRIALHTLSGAVTVSDGAILNGANGPYVYRIGPDGKAAAQDVSIGPSVGGVTVVTRGLRPGDRVAASGQLRLKPGSVVAVQRQLP